MSSISLKQQESDRRTGMIATIVFHALLLLLFLFIGLKQPNPLPKEEAIELAFEDAGGPSGGDTSPAATEAPAPPVEETAPDDAEPIATEEEGPVAIPKAEKPKPKPKPDPKPVERKPDSRSLFEASNTGSTSQSTSSTSGGGSSSSTGTGGGSEGGSGAFAGKGFQGKLTGRGLMRGPSITEKPNEGGRVSLDIFVDRTGKVTHVSLNLDRSTTTSQVLYNLARKAALQCTFSAKPDGPAEQKGEMTFIFELQ